MSIFARTLAAALVGLALALAAPAQAAQEAERAARLMQRLIAAYPDHLVGHEGNMLVWRDGTRMPFDDGRGNKGFEDLLEDPDIEDQFHWAYVAGPPQGPPPPDHDPGRARNQAFFAKMYGDCRKGEVAGKLVDVVWLPGHGGMRLRATRINGVAERLQAVSKALDSLPAHLIAYVRPPAGVYNCRSIAGTTRLSPHSFAFAIDINVKFADYWLWNAGAKKAVYGYRNRVPWPIVDTFERHGFIWGGKWYHYDTMHFEYRPELLGTR